MKKELIVYNTHIEIFPYEKGELEIVENIYTATHSFTQEEFPCGYLIHDKRLYLPRGTSIIQLEDLLGIKAKYELESDMVENMSREHKSLFEPRNDLQSKAIEFLNTNRTQLGLLLYTGVGKGNPVTTKIPTLNGYKLMGDLQVGDLIFSRNGLSTKVTKIFELGVSDIYKVTFADGRVSYCTDEHLWLVKTYKNSNTWHPIETHKLFNWYKSGRLNYKSTDNNRDYFFQVYIPICEPVQYPSRNLPVHPYVLGAFIGNGCCREKYLSISSGNDFVPNKIAKLCGFVAVRSSTKNYTYRFYSKKDDCLIRTREFFDKVPELINKYSYEKYIPDIYLYNDHENVMELLRGLMDTDGSIGNSGEHPRHNLSYSSTSRKLLLQIQQIIYSQGYRAHIREDNRTDGYTSGFCGSVQFMIPNKIKPQYFSLPYKLEIAQKASTISQKNYYNDLRIKSIEYSHKENARCISVDNPERLYLTEDFIVTHNTFVGSYVITSSNVCGLIITPSDGLKVQWYNTFLKMFDYKENELLNISGSDIMERIVNDEIKQHDVYFVNHQTLRSFLNNHNPYMLHQFFKKLKIGIKIYDEAHLEFANILLIDNFSNTDKTLYLTATFDRSDKSESRCFKQAFNSVITFGEKESLNITRKHVIYYPVYINSRIQPKQMRKLMKFGSMSSASYGRYAFMEDKNHTMWNTIKIILDKTKNVEGKTLIFVPLIEIIDDLEMKIKDEFPDKSVGAYHSKMAKDDKESNLKKDIIISTIKSCGTGRDIPGLRQIISTESYSSKVMAQQLLGRLREYAPDKNTYLWDIADTSVYLSIAYFRSRMKKLSELAKEVIYINLDE